MNPKSLALDLENRTGIRVLIQGLFAASILGNLIIGSVAFNLSTRSVRTQLVPPNISKSFWVDSATLESDYLEEMGGYVITVFASFTPGSADFKKNTLLKMVHPSTYGDLNKRWTVAVNRIKQDGISRIFWPREVRVQKETKSVALCGLLETWIADKRSGDPKMTCYVVVFANDGITTIKDLHEADTRDPFAPPKAEGETP